MQSSGDSMSERRKVTVIEVGPRDGLQIEPDFIPTATKISLINDLIAAGIPAMEATSFVSPRAVPQLADAPDVVAGIDRSAGADIMALVPNPRGAGRAVEAGVDTAVLFVSASDSHNLRNMNKPTAGTLAGFAEVAEIARAGGLRIHGAIATAFGCPFEGDVPLESVFRVADCYAGLGVTSMSLCDTTGMATPPLVRRTCEAFIRRFPGVEVALHFHNTRGLGLANVLAGLDCGVDRYDSSLAGIGGCPFAPGATGNICTEDLVHMLHEMDIETGINLDGLIAAARRLEGIVGRELPGQVMKAGPRLTRHRMEAVATAVG